MAMIMADLSETVNRFIAGSQVEWGRKAPLEGVGHSPKMPPRFHHDSCQILGPSLAGNKRESGEERERKEKGRKAEEGEGKEEVATKTNKSR